MFLVNSRLDLFTAAPVSSRSPEGSVYQPRRSFSRSYGAMLPSSLTRVLSSALEYSSRLPVSVCGTDACMTRERSLFLEAWYQPLRQHRRSRRHVSESWATGFTWLAPPTRLNAAALSEDSNLLPSLRWSNLLRHSTLKCHAAGTGMLTRCPSATPFGLALGSD